MWIEHLESRRHLAVTAPQNVTSVMLQVYANSAWPMYGYSGTKIDWADVSGETGYRAEFSVDGSTGWQDFNGTLSAGTTTTTAYVDDSGRKLYFRIIAFDATSEATSSVTSPLTDEDFAIALSFNSAATTSGTTLEWPADSRVTGYTLERRQIEPAASGVVTTSLSASLTSYHDVTSVADITYEYTLRGARSIGETVGKLLVSREAPAKPSHGNVLLVIDETIQSDETADKRDLATKLRRYKEDLVSDGWRVTTIEVDRDTDNDSDASDVVAVKTAIRNVYNSLGGDLASIVLVGHVPLPLSGLYSVDGHVETAGAWPADVYYGDLLGDQTTGSMWTDTLYGGNTSSYPANQNIPGDGKFDQDFAPSAVEVPVSRIDLSNLSSLAAEYQTTAANAEILGLSRYFDRNHSYRVGDLSVPKRALLDDGFADRLYLTGEARSAYALTGAMNSDWRDWTQLQTDAYLWGFGSGPGFPGETMVGIATPVDYRDYAYKSVFNTLWGSYATDWDRSTSLMRGVLANRGNGLAVITGTYDWSLHLMGLGEPLNTVLAQTTPAREAHATLLGDPTLRQDIVKPATGVRVVSTQAGDAASSGEVQTTVSWTESADTLVSGYDIFWAAEQDGGSAGYTQLNTSGAVTGHSFTDPDAADHLGGYYMIRARKLEVTPSGSYWNLGTGSVGSALVTDASFFWSDAPQALTLEFSPDAVSMLSGATVSIVATQWEDRKSVV